MELARGERSREWAPATKFDAMVRAQRLPPGHDLRKRFLAACFGPFSGQ
jgi:hypothetical protein